MQALFASHPPHGGPAAERVKQIRLGTGQALALLFLGLGHNALALEVTVERLACLSVLGAVGDRDRLEAVQALALIAVEVLGAVGAMLLVGVVAGEEQALLPAAEALAGEHVYPIVILSAQKAR